MYKNRSFTTFLIAIVLLFSMGFACKQTESDPAPAPNNAPTAKSEGPDNAPKPLTASAKDISGTYLVTGTNESGGGAYSGSLQITKRDSVYQFSWDTAGKRMEGVGVQTDNNIAAAFTEGDDGTGCGVVLYKIGSDGSLNGKAGYWGVNQSETETAKRISGSDLEGEYDVNGSNPNGEPYESKLAVKKSGLGYIFDWDGKLNGFGIRQSDKVAVGIGGSKCGFVSYEIKPDGTLDGKWGGYGSTSVGTETAKRQ